MSDLTEALATGLWRRLRDVILVAERIEDFAFGPGEEGRKALVAADADAMARDLVLRAFRLASDGINWQILTASAQGDAGATFEDLAVACSLPRLAIAERANELLQAGLCVRALDADRLLATQAGDAVIALVREVAGGLAKRAIESTERERSNGGLPLL